LLRDINTAQVRSFEGSHKGKGVGLGGLSGGMLVCVRVGGVVLVNTSSIFDSVMLFPGEGLDPQLTKRKDVRMKINNIPVSRMEGFIF
jgi:hypothetical protein